MRKKREPKQLSEAATVAPEQPSEPTPRDIPKPWKPQTPDWGIWLLLDSWETWQARFLVCNMEPPERADDLDLIEVADPNYKRIGVMVFHAIMGRGISGSPEKIFRYDGKMNMVDPASYVAWCLHKGLDVPTPMLAIVKDDTVEEQSEEPQVVPTQAAAARLLIQAHLDYNESGEGSIQVNPPNTDAAKKQIAYAIKRSGKLPSPPIPRADLDNYIADQLTKSMNSAERDYFG